MKNWNINFLTMSSKLSVLNGFQNLLLKKAVCFCSKHLDFICMPSGDGHTIFTIAVDTCMLPCRSF